MLRSQSTTILSLEHFHPIRERLGEVLDDACARSHVHSKQGVSPNDRGNNFRSFAINGLDELETPYGLIESQPQGEVQPVGTTWLRIPTSLGSENVMVNCVKPLGGNRYKLVRGDAGALPSFVVQRPLWQSEEGIQDILLGITWRLYPPKRGMPKAARVQTNLLGGRLDRKNRIFHADTVLPLHHGEYGAGGAGGVLTPAPVGPTPNISAR